MRQTYADGWQDALRMVRAEVAQAEACCLNCLLDRAVFSGIVAAMDSADLQPAHVARQISDDATMALVAVAMDPDLEQRAQVASLARHLVDDEPAIAAQVVTSLALLMGKHHGASGWGTT